MGFKKDDTVRVVTQNHSMRGALGTVVFAYSDGNGYVVQFASGIESSFHTAELEAVADPERERLIELAETLDQARLQANAIEVTAPQRGVYGQISQALFDTLELLYIGTDDDHNLYANKIYDDMLSSGNTVRESIAYVEKNYVNKEEV